MAAFDALRTPDDRFEGLPGYAFAPHYVDDLEGYHGLRMHFIDEGPRKGSTTFLCLHGMPTWAYLYRKMIPVFTAAGHRAVAPDLFGFGRSDKPVRDADYSFHFHRNALLRFVESLQADDICLVVQDWGGLLGLTLPMEFTARITRLIVMNTALATGRPPGEGFLAWRQFVADNPDFDIAGLMKRAVDGLSEAEAEAYAAPFPDSRHRAGARRFPAMVMTAPEMEGVDSSLRALRFLQEEWTGDSFMAIGMQDPVLGPDVMHALRRQIRGCPEPLELPEAGHFVQEYGAQVAEAALKRFGLT